MIKCAIVGGSGYIGGELIHLLSHHPYVELVAITAHEAAGRTISDIHPNLNHLHHVFHPLYEVGDADVLFLALPHGKAMKSVEIWQNRTIIDTSADFRIRTLSSFEDFYKTTHTAFEKTPLFAYGLPELFRNTIQTANHIASPGCFATIATLSAFPLVKTGLAQTILINAVTGSSGSGIKPKESTHHPFRTDSYFAYEQFTHRHIPEIEQALLDATGTSVNLIFQPHSGPFIRGIFATTMLPLTEKLSQKDLEALYEAQYGAEAFIRFKEKGVNLKWVLRTHFFDYHVKTNGHFAIITSAIDNLLRGGASQAVHAFNLKFGFPESLGLPCFISSP